MPDQENAALEQEAGESLSLIADLRGTEPEETTTPATTEPTEEATEPEDNEADAEARRTALLREIAIDPALTNQYIQQTYQAPQQQYQPQQQAQVDQTPVLPFDEFSFDPSNPTHQQALFDARLNEIGGPLFQKIDAIAQRFEQEDQQRQVVYMQQVANHANQKTVEFLDTYVPGFSGIAQKISKNEMLTVQEEAVFNMAVNMESQFLTAYPQAVYDVRARAQIAQQIGPTLKEKAKALGLVSQPKAQLTPEQKQQIKRESYVESSSAVPANSAGSFEKAAKKGDSLSMIAALRAK